MWLFWRHHSSSCPQNVAQRRASLVMQVVQGLLDVLPHAVQFRGPKDGILVRTLVMYSCSCLETSQVTALHVLEVMPFDSLFKNMYLYAARGAQEKEIKQRRTNEVKLGCQQHSRCTPEALVCFQVLGSTAIPICAARP